MKMFLSLAASVILLGSPAAAKVYQTTVIYVGAIRGAETLASPLDMAKLKRESATSFYLTSFALTQVRELNLAAVLANWRGHPPGILEVGTDPKLMGDIASKYGRYLTPTNTWTWNGTRGVGWPSLIATAGWQPQTVMLNTFLMGHGSGDPGQDPYYRMNLLAIADVRAAAPSAIRVLPYLTANNVVITPKNGNDSWSSPYWSETRDLALEAGGFGLDMPAQYFLKVRETAYRDMAIQQIQWARTHHLTSNVLLSIYAMERSSGVQPQFGHDAHFVEAVQKVVKFLHEHNADPSFYSIVNYSEGPTSNTPGPDNEHETLGAAALWAVHHATVRSKN